MYYPIVVLHRDRQERVNVCSILREHFQILDAHSLEQVDLRLSRCPPQLLFAELPPCREHGIELVHRLRAAFAAVEVVVLTSKQSRAHAIAAVHAGAFGFVTDSTDAQGILSIAHEALENVELTKLSQTRYSTVRPIFHNPKIRAIERSLPGIAASRRHVLITGETGTGRKTTARALHLQSPYPGVLRFWDCASSSDRPLSSTVSADALVGQCDAASTQSRMENTVCLLNVERLTEQDLSRLKDLCDQPLIARLSDTTYVPVQYRVVAIATQPYPQQPGEPSTLQIFTAPPFDATRVELPPLRHRTEDLPILCAEIAERFAARKGIQAKTLSQDALEAFATYPCPGNLLELRDVIERMLLVCSEDTMDASMIPLDVHINSWKRGLSYRNAMEQLEREFLSRVLRRTGGCRQRAAEKLRLSYRTLKFRLRKLGLTGESLPP